MKIIVKDVIYTKIFDNYYQEIKFSDLPKDIQNNDIIDIHRVDAEFTENNSYDACTELHIIRERLENDTEYEKRLSKLKKQEDELRNKRYENYLKLKNEFEQL